MLKIFLDRLGSFNKTSNILNLKRRSLTYSLCKSTWNLLKTRINSCRNIKEKMWINTLKINSCKKSTVNHTLPETLILRVLFKKMSPIKEKSLNLQDTMSTSFQWLLIPFHYKGLMKLRLLIKLWQKFLKKTLMKKKYSSSIFTKKKRNKRLKGLL